MAAGEKPHKMLYTMGEVSEMFDVKPSLLRFWEGKFDVLRPQKNKKGNRLFTPEDVRNLKIIYHLVKERGMTLAGAEKYMKADRRQIERDMQLAERLQSIRALLAEVRDSLGDEEVLTGGVFDEAGTPTAEKMTDFESEVSENAMDADALMREAIAELEQDDEPEEMPDFQPEAGTPAAEEMTEPETEPETETSAKPQFVEQTLFDL